MILAGIDAGSRSIKVVLFDDERSVVVGAGIADQGVEQGRLAADLYQRTIEAAGIHEREVTGIVATGHGRNAVRFAEAAVTEITCHARGVYQLVPGARTILEIGGQDSKVIHLDGDGRVHDFSMNDRCAAGTGRFLEVVAARLGVDLPELSKLSELSRNPVLISSMCVVFAETEIIGLLAGGTPPEDIAAGVQNAIATRVAGMAGRALERPAYFTGGVALQTGMAQALEGALACPIHVAPQPQYTGALGAAILASRGHRTGRYL